MRLPCLVPFMLENVALNKALMQADGLTPTLLRNPFYWKRFVGVFEGVVVGGEDVKLRAVIRINYGYTSPTLF